MQSLFLAHELFATIADGSKRATIRLGERAIVPGRLMLISSADETVRRVVTVTQVCVKEWHDLNRADAESNGCADIATLQRDLRRFYPGAQDGDRVTVIRFEA